MSDAVAITKSPGCGLFGSKTGFMTLALCLPRFDADGFCGIALRDVAGVGVGVGVPFFCGSLGSGCIRMMIFIPNCNLSLRDLGLGVVSLRILAHIAFFFVFFFQIRSHRRRIRRYRRLFVALVLLRLIFYRLVC